MGGRKKNKKIVHKNDVESEESDQKTDSSLSSFGDSDSDCVCDSHQESMDKERHYYLRTMFKVNEYLNFQKIKEVYKDIKKFMVFTDKEERTPEKIDEWIKKALNGVSNENKIHFWPRKLHTFCLVVYKRHPQIYNALQSYFDLPSDDILEQLFNEIELPTGTQMFDDVERKFNKFPPKHRYCCLTFHKISLKEGEPYYDRYQFHDIGKEDYGHLMEEEADKSATHAIVFMVRGINSPWKQVISYYFFSDETPTEVLANLIKYNIETLQDSNLKVVAISCPPNDFNRRTISDLCLENKKKNTDFHFLVNNQNVVVMYDVPHLLMTTRDAFVKCNINYDKDKVAKYEYIREAFNIDLKEDTRFLYHISQDDFNTDDPFIKTKVSAAAKQLGFRMAAYTYLKWSKKQISEDAEHTPEFVYNINNLFDSLNGWKKYSKAKVDHGENTYKCRLSKQVPHVKLWNKLLKQMNDWKFIDSTTGEDVTSQYRHIVESWQITLKSVKQLWDHGYNNTKFTFLTLSYFNIDPLENLFALIRKNPTEDPSYKEFIEGLKVAILDTLKFDGLVESCCLQDPSYGLTSRALFMLPLEALGESDDEYDDEDDSNYSDYTGGSESDVNEKLSHFDEVE